MDSEGARPLLLEVIADHRSLLPDTVRSEFEDDLNYNFVADSEELRFHHTCQMLCREGCTEYVEAVIGGCVEKGPHVLKYLFQLRNAQGQTPLHVAVLVTSGGKLVSLIPRQESESGGNADCLNMRDSSGWTALHYCASFGGPFNDDAILRVLLEDGRADVNARVSGRLEATFYTIVKDCPGATPLHLAVLHNNSKAVERLLHDSRIDVNALFHTRIYFDDNLYVHHFGHPLKEWTALQLAAVAGLPKIVKVLLKCPKVCICFHDQGRIQLSHKFYTLNLFVNALIILEPKNIQNERLHVIEHYAGHGIEYKTHGYLYKHLLKFH